MISAQQQMPVEAIGINVRNHSVPTLLIYVQTADVYRLDKLGAALRLTQVFVI